MRLRKHDDEGALPVTQVRWRRLHFEPLEDRCLLSADTNSLFTLSPLQQSDEQAVAAAVNAFSQDLYAQLTQANPTNNLVYSPLSIAVALGMAYAGAEGETASQMASTLRLTTDQTDTEIGFGALLGELAAEGESGNFKLNVADSLWMQQGFQIGTQFLAEMQSLYGSAVNQVDYIHAAAAATDQINSWVATATNGKITNLIPEDQLDQYTRLVLTNAVYFKGDWASSFDLSETANLPFTLATGMQESVPTMRQTSDFQYMDSDGYQVLEMPYQGNDLSMVIVLPDGTGAAGSTMPALPTDVGTWLQGLSTYNVDVSLPKFTVNDSLPLRGVLATLGMTDAMSDAADFDGIHDPAVDGKSLHIAAVDHAASIDVGEQGTEAAAASGVIARVACIVLDSNPTAVFDANHPFEFLIVDNQSGTILFQGQVTNPDSTASPYAAPDGTPLPVLPGPLGPLQSSGSPSGNGSSGTTAAPAPPASPIAVPVPPAANQPASTIQAPVQGAPPASNPITPPSTTETPSPVAAPPAFNTADHSSSGTGSDTVDNGQGSATANEVAPAAPIAASPGVSTTDDATSPAAQDPGPAPTTSQASGDDAATEPFVLAGSPTGVAAAADSALSVWTGSVAPPTPPAPAATEDEDVTDEAISAELPSSDQGLSRTLPL